MMPGRQPTALPAEWLRKHAHVFFPEIAKASGNLGSALASGNHRSTPTHTHHKPKRATTGRGGNRLRIELSA